MAALVQIGESLPPPNELYATQQSVFVSTLTVRQITMYRAPVVGVGHPMLAMTQHPRLLRPLLRQRLHRRFRVMLSAAPRAHAHNSNSVHKHGREQHDPALQMLLMIMPILLTTMRALVPVPNALGKVPA